MSRPPMRPLPKESEKRIDLVRARHEVKIRSVVLNWRTERTRSRPPVLTTQQQSELQALLVAMSVELGETEGRERLSATPNSSQFVGEIEDLLMTVAGEARDRWESLTSDFGLEVSTEGEDNDAKFEVFHRVLELLKSPLESLILQFWYAYEKRLQAECEGDGRLPAAVRTNPERPTSEGAARTESEVAAMRRSVVLPILKQKRWTRGKLVTESGVGKNCVYEYLDGKRNPGYENRRAMADALELKVEELPD